jgi:divalent metal cation (Fe/Co/Zn/Cd) transporter
MKSASQRPDIWYVIVPLLGMLYLAQFNPLRFLQLNSLFGTVIGLLIVSAWLFLAWDFMKQLSLFFRAKTK